MKFSTISYIAFLTATTVVEAGPVIGIAARVGVGVAKKAIGGAIKNGAKHAAKEGAKQAVSGGNNNNNKKKGKRDFFDDEEDVVLVSRDHSVQEWIDLTYNPTAGSGISKEIIDLLATMGRTPPAAGTQCATKTKHIPEFNHKIKIDHQAPIPRDQAVAGLKQMAKETDPNKKLFFAALEVAFQLNCWTVPADVKAIIDSKGWMQSVAQAKGATPSPAASQPAPRSIEESDDDIFDFFSRDVFGDDDDSELITREAEAEADAEFDLWIREADAEADAEGFNLLDDETFFFEDY